MHTAGPCRIACIMETMKDIQGVQACLSCPWENRNERSRREGSCSPLHCSSSGVWLIRETNGTCHAMQRMQHFSATPLLPCAGLLEQADAPAAGGGGRRQWRGEPTRSRTWWAHSAGRCRSLRSHDLAKLMRMSVDVRRGRLQEAASSAICSPSAQRRPCAAHWCAHCAHYAGLIGPICAYTCRRLHGPCTMTC